MVVIHSTNIVDSEDLFDEPSAVVKVQLSNDDDSESCISWNSGDSDMSSSHWGTESDPGIERVWRQLCDLQSIDGQAYRIFFEALNVCQTLHLDVKLADLFLRRRLGTSSMSQVNASTRRTD